MILSSRVTTWIPPIGGGSIHAHRHIRSGIVLLDIGLPNLDGYQVAERMRRQPNLREVQLVAITGYGQDADRLRTREAGFAAHLVKPVDFADLKRALAALRSGRFLPAPRSGLH